MLTIEQQLDNLARLQVLMNSSAVNNRALLAKEEASKLDKEISLLSRYPEIELRWLNFHAERLNSHLNQLELRSSFKVENDAEEKINSDLLSLFAHRCARVIDNFVDQHKTKINPAGGLAHQEKERLEFCVEELNASIKEQQKTIFSACLLRATRGYLNSYQKTPEKPFLPEAILTNACELYKEQMIKETMLVYEATGFIRYYARIKSQTNVSQTSERSYLENTLHIEEKYNKRTSSFELVDHEFFGDLSPFLREEFKKLYEDEFLVTAELTPESLQLPIEAFFEKYKATRNTTSSFDIILTHQFRDFRLIEQMTAVLNFAEEQASTEIPAKDDNSLYVETRNEELKKLRTIIQEYKAHLDKTLAEEIRTYPNRKPEAIENRSKAVASIILFVNSSAELTPLVRKAVKNSIAEIQQNEPSWFERSLIDKILDVISLGARPILRYLGSKPVQSQSELFQQPETLSQEKTKNKGDASQDSDDASQELSEGESPS
ncbi:MULTISPECIES: hypothetical protein [Legionella]|uniref:Uncharacterized protein n=1 Tax=Legionella drozanskii LLAP-1 TaxID=1212489 RepID=A0A0W0SY32_9GAMM|nr:MULTISPECIES: hypothetical protein [Legionella]KTC88241.1 hypothetical protein Ldro_0835 [Legionella drozanskii LLAP-1]PJE17382.1 MAG: hypothetical protein CK430_02685 [Legionella sp.]